VNQIIHGTFKNVLSSDQCRGNQLVPRKMAKESVKWPSADWQGHLTTDTLTGPFHTAQPYVLS
jgi:hypothetical protein